MVRVVASSDHRGGLEPGALRGSAEYEERAPQPDRMCRPDSRRGPTSSGRRAVGHGKSSRRLEARPIGSHAGDVARQAAFRRRVSPCCPSCRRPPAGLAKSGPIYGTAQRQIPLGPLVAAVPEPQIRHLQHPVDGLAIPLLRASGVGGAHEPVEKLDPAAPRPRWRPGRSSIWSVMPFLWETCSVPCPSRALARHGVDWGLAPSRSA